ncbi:MAG: leucine-rich repeat domain-containing protein [Treponemataceae bacterium]|nr:leucine-rich repeat domain-containing protein [Treponemataceae bacterium]
MKKMAKATALLAAMVLAAGLTACQGKGSSKGLVMVGAIVGNYTPDVPAKFSIPKGTTEIYQRAFEDCLKLVSVNIPDTVVKIGMSAFSGCKNLKSVTIGNGVTEIGSGAFYGCESLKSVTIPEGVTEIYSQAFRRCTSLASVTIPASVTEIWECVFKGCESLKEVKYAGTKAQWEEALTNSYHGERMEIGNIVVHCKDGDVTETLKD